MKFMATRGHPLSKNHWSGKYHVQISFYYLLICFTEEEIEIKHRFQDNRTKFEYDISLISGFYSMDAPLWPWISFTNSHGL